MYSVTVVLVLLGVLFVPAISVGYEASENGELKGTVLPFPGGDGSGENPFQITNWTHLQSINDFLTNSFVLLNNLDEDTDGYDEFVDTEEGWYPIGDKSESFMGSFDGQNNVIRDLKINEIPEHNLVGLFGEIGLVGGIDLVGEVSQSAHIRDLNIGIEVDINIEEKTDLLLGGLAGSSVFCSVENVHTNGNINIQNPNEEILETFGVAGITNSMEFFSPWELTEFNHVTSEVDISIDNIIGEDSNSMSVVSGVVGTVKSQTEINEISYSGSIHIGKVEGTFGTFGVGLVAAHFELSTYQSFIENGYYDGSLVIDSVNYEVVGVFGMVLDGVTAFGMAYDQYMTEDLPYMKHLYSVGSISVPENMENISVLSAGMRSEGEVWGEPIPLIDSMALENEVYPLYINWNEGALNTTGRVEFASEEDMQNIDLYTEDGFGDYDDLDEAWDIEITHDEDLADGYPFLSWELGSESIWYIYEEPDDPDEPDEWFPGLITLIWVLFLLVLVMVMVVYVIDRFG